METRVCNRCETSKPLTAFSKRTLRCRACQNEIWEANCRAKGEDPGQVRRDRKNVARAMNRRGLKHENTEWTRNAEQAKAREQHYRLQFEKQGGVCAISGLAESRLQNGTVTALSRDHAHDTGQFRGLLTYNCNSALGYFRENTEILRSAIRYLLKYSEPRAGEPMLYNKNKKYATDGSLCEICGQPETRTYRGKLMRPVMDHDHATGALRGVLCHACNLGLGHLRDSAESLQACVDYLLAWGRPEGVSCVGGNTRLTNPPPARTTSHPELVATGNTGVGRRRYT